MKKVFSIGIGQIEVDIKATGNFYQIQNDIPKDFDFGDCMCFFETFIHKPYQMLRFIVILKMMKQLKEKKQFYILLFVYQKEK